MSAAAPTYKTIQLTLPEWQAVKFALEDQKIAREEDWAFHDTAVTRNRLAETQSALAKVNA